MMMNGWRINGYLLMTGDVDDDDSLLMKMMMMAGDEDDDESWQMKMMMVAGG